METSLSISIKMSRLEPTWRNVPAYSSWRPPALRIHSSFEVVHAACCHRDLTPRDCARVLLESTEEDQQVPGSLVENPVAGISKPDPHLSHLSMDLGGNRVLRGRRIRRLPVQVLFDERMDLRPPLGGQGLDELGHRLHAMLIAIEDCLDSRHEPSIAEEIDRYFSVNERDR
jgi:hypothetical protein